jgi:hypothetical protein
MAQRVRFRTSLDTGSRHDEELDDPGTEGFSHLLKHGDRRVFQPSFKAAHVGPINAGISGEGLL